MSNSVFPQFLGMTYSTIKGAQWNTAQTRTPVGKTSRIARQAMPTWNFTLKFSYLNRRQRYQYAAQVPVAAALSSVQNLIANDFDALAGFINARQGAYDSWLFEDPRDEAVAQAQVGIGDGLSLSFQLNRRMGEFLENLQNINGTPIAAATWQPGTLTSLNGLVVPTPSAILTQQDPIVANWQSVGWPAYYQCTSAGRTGVTEPNWRQNAPLTGMTLTDNTTVWTCMGTPLLMYFQQALPDWAAGAKSLNQSIMPLSNNAGGFTFICTNAGPGGSQPLSWPQSLGATVAEGGGGGAVWTNYGVSAAGISDPLVLQLPSQYILGPTGIVTFNSAPANPLPIYATFAFWFRCHFLKDANDFELFMNNFYSMATLQFESLIT